MSQTHNESGPESPPVTPGWVKLFGAVVLVLIVLYIILHLAGLAPTGSH